MIQQIVEDSIKKVSKAEKVTLGCEAALISLLNKRSRIVQ